MTEKITNYIKVTKMIKNCLLDNIQVAIDDEIKQLKRLRKTVKTEEQFRKMKWYKSHELHGMLFLVYMSSDLKVKDEIYESLLKQIHDLIMISYYDED